MEVEMHFRLPYHLIMDCDTADILDDIRKDTNPKLRNNHLINRCIKFTNYVVRRSVYDPDFRNDLDRMLQTDDFRKFFFRGGIK
jgi:hypothetical protein